MDKEEIPYEDFSKLDIRIGTVVAAELVPDTDKLIKCSVDFGLKPSAGANGLGERDIRTIVSGIAEWKSPSDLVEKQFPYVVNLAPRIIRGIASEGMILAIRTKDGVSLLCPDSDVESGSRIS
ncbi:MAG: hypothetical protein Q7S75_02135 [bacterium]|nr:hypothetical protein [bacterium]